MIDGIFQTVELLGGLGLFLYGMRVMSDNIQRRAGTRMRRVLRIFTSNPFGGVATGLAVTSVIQSSSATTVLLVSIVNAGLMSLEQAIGVIMGANIGTTFTAWIVSILGFKFKITTLALPAIALGIPLFFSRREKWREMAGILIGFGILFLGLHVMKESVPDIKNNPEALAVLSHLAGDSYLSIPLFILVGTLLTIAVQSSSAAMAITITMAFRGWIDLPIAAAIVLGENIGTTITAYLASLGMNVQAKRAARAHMLFNVMGVAWMLAVFFPFLRMIDSIIPGPGDVAANIPIHLSAFHTAFNLINTGLLIGFVPVLSRISRKLVPDPQQPLEDKLAFVTTQTSEDVDANLISVQAELRRMSNIVIDMAMWVMNSLQQDSEAVKATRAKVKSYEDKTDEIRDNISAFLTNCMTSNLSEEQANRIRAMYRLAHEYESVADGCRSVVGLLDRRAAKQATFHDTGVLELAEYHGHVLDFIKYNHDCLTGAVDAESVETAKTMENNLNRGRNRLRKVGRRTLSEGADVRGELIFLDVVRFLEQMGDHCYNIAQEIQSVRNGSVPVGRGQG